MATTPAPQSAPVVDTFVVTVYVLWSGELPPETVCVAEYGFGNGSVNGAAQAGSGAVNVVLGRHEKDIDL